MDSAVPRVQRARGGGRQRLMSCLPFPRPTPRSQAALRETVHPSKRDVHFHTPPAGDVAHGAHPVSATGRSPRPLLGVPRRFRRHVTPPRLPGRRGRRWRRTQPCLLGSSLWSQLARPAARRQEVVSEWGPLPRQDVSGLGRRRRGAQVQLGDAVQARWRPGSGPRPQPG